jgi:hypothetical protein
MGKFTERLKSMFRRRRPVTVEEAEVLSNWVNEGGTYDPDGPPPVVRERDEPADGATDR